MSAIPQFPEDHNPSSPPSRTAQVSVDDMGITIIANLRLTGVSRSVGDLFKATPPSDHAGLLENVIILGGTTLAAASEVSAADAARAKLTAVAEAVQQRVDRMADDHDRRMESMEERVANQLEQLRTQRDEDREQEAKVRAELAKAHGDITKAAQAMNTSRAELETKITEAVGGLDRSQASAKESMIEATSGALRKLLDKDDPASAPALIKAVVDQAAAELRQTTGQNVETLTKQLTELLGEASPLVERVGKIVREGAETEIKRVQEQVETLRNDVLVARTREVHDPNVRGENYEHNLQELLGAGAAVHGWTAERTGAAIGDEAGSKKGDHLIYDHQLQPLAAVEARARKNVSARQLFEGLHGTAVNRGVKIVAYFAASSAELPTGLGEFSHGRVPLHLKALPDGVQALVTVIDPSQDHVVERLSLVLWLIGQLHQQAQADGDDDGAARRIERAMPCIAQIAQRLAAFRTIKGGLTKATGEIRNVRGKVEELETLLGQDITRVSEILAGDTDAEDCEDF
jgi:hypothetical protein